MSKWDRGMTPETRAALNAIAKRHGFTLERLQAPGRFKALCIARADCYRYLAEKDWSTPAIGGLFNRDHTTVLWWLDPQRTEAKRERCKARYHAKIKAVGERPMGARRAG